jgi:uroporphyrinogen decarboxylase
MIPGTDWSKAPKAASPPNFNNLLAVLNREIPDRPTLFEFGFNYGLRKKLLGGEKLHGQNDDLAGYVGSVHAWRNAGYDYFPIGLPGLHFAAGEREKQKTVSLDKGNVISDRRTFDDYKWPNTDNIDDSILGKLAPEIPEGMKLVIRGGGVLENAVSLVGYEDLCYMVVDNEQLVFDIFEAIGSRFVKYYEIAAQHDIIGACIANDDWGFISHTMLSPEDMRRFVFPWHKRIAEVVHAAGKPAILHSCGHFERVVEDIIEDMKYDARHSYEDNICPVEDVYEKYHDRMGILGGIDVDFICQSTPEEVYERSVAMLARADGRGSYALGTGNSVPDYVPDDGYFAMLYAALDGR